METRLFSNQRLIKLIIPLVIEQGLTILVGMADGVMVSSVGEAAISGVSLVDMIAAVILVLFAALATGGAVVTSQYLGARNMEKARRSAGQLILMATALGVVIMVPCLIFSEQLLMLCFGAIELDVKAAGLTYMRITALSFPVQCRCGHLPQRGQQQGVHAGIYADECDQRSGQCFLHLRVEMGRCGRGGTNADFPHGGRYLHDGEGGEARSGAAAHQRRTDLRRSEDDGQYHGHRSSFCL